MVSWLDCGVSNSASSSGCAGVNECAVVVGRGIVGSFELEAFGCGSSSSSSFFGGFTVGTSIGFWCPGNWTLCFLICTLAFAFGGLSSESCDTSLCFNSFWLSQVRFFWTWFFISNRLHDLLNCFIRIRKHWSCWNWNYNRWHRRRHRRRRMWWMRWLSTWRRFQVWIIHIPVTVTILFPRVICTFRWHVFIIFRWRAIIVRMNWIISVRSNWWMRWNYFSVHRRINRCPSYGSTGLSWESNDIPLVHLKLLVVWIQLWHEHKNKSDDMNLDSKEE